MVSRLAATRNDGHQPGANWPHTWIFSWPLAFSLVAAVADASRRLDAADRRGFPLTAARRSSAYADQMIAYCCGGFPSLAADLPAVVFGAGACPEIRPSAGLNAWRAHAEPRRAAAITETPAPGPVSAGHGGRTGQHDGVAGSTHRLPAAQVSEEA